MTNASSQAEALRAQILDLVGEYHRLAHPTPVFTPGQSAAPVSGRVFDAHDMQALVESALRFLAHHRTLQR